MEFLLPIVFYHHGLETVSSAMKSASNPDLMMFWCHSIVNGVVTVESGKPGKDQHEVSYFLLQIYSMFYIESFFYCKLPISK